MTPFDDINEQLENAAVTGAKVAASVLDLPITADETSFEMSLISPVVARMPDVKNIVKELADLGFSKVNLNIDSNAAMESKIATFATPVQTPNTPEKTSGIIKS